jgi:hypothetical protein
LVKSIPPNHMAAFKEYFTGKSKEVELLLQEFIQDLIRS